MLWFRMQPGWDFSGIPVFPYFTIAGQIFKCISLIYDIWSAGWTLLLAWHRMHPGWDFSDIPPWTNVQSHKANWGSFGVHLTTLKLWGIIISRRCYNYILIIVRPVLLLAYSSCCSHQYGALQTLQNFTKLYFPIISEKYHILGLSTYMLVTFSKHYDDEDGENNGLNYEYC